MELRKIIHDQEIYVV